MGLSLACPKEKGQMSLLRVILVQFLLSEECSSLCELTASSNRQLLSSWHRAETELSLWDTYKLIPVLFVENGHLSSCCSTVLTWGVSETKHCILQIRKQCPWSNASVLFGKVQCNILKWFKSGLRVEVQFSRYSIKKSCSGCQLSPLRVKN